MGASGGAFLLLLCVACGLANDETIRNRRDVHRIIIREQVAASSRARGPQHHYRAPPPPPASRGHHREHVDGRHRVPYDSHEISDEYEVKNVNN